MNALAQWDNVAISKWIESNNWNWKLARLVIYILNSLNVY